MAFGMKINLGGDFAPIVKFDARAGRLFRIDRDPVTSEKTSVDITQPPPTFAVDFGSLTIGYIRFTTQGPDCRLVPEGQQLPVQPDDRDDKGRLLFRPGFKVQLYGRVLGGLREWCSTAGCVVNSVDDLYEKFRADPNAAAARIPVVTLVSAIPIVTGSGTNKTTTYAPAFRIDSWVDRVLEMGVRTVPPPKPQTQAPAPAMATADDFDDDIPF